MGFIAWLLNTKLGRTVLLLVIVALCWWGFSAHYTEVGYQTCQQEHRDAQAKADREQAAKNELRNETASEIANDATEATVDVINKADNASAETKKEIKYAYLERPRTAPLALGSCAHPLDGSVQQRLEEAVDRAND